MYQVYKTKVFAPFNEDFWLKNSTDTLNAYPLSKVTAPVALYYSSNDGMVAVEDVKLLQQELPNVVEDYLVPNELWNHVDFVFSTQSKTFNEHVLTIEAKFDEN